MSTMPPNVKIDIVAVFKGWDLMVQRVGEYIRQIGEVMRSWFPYVSESHRASVKRAHRLYRRRQLARRRRNRKRR